MKRKVTETIEIAFTEGLRFAFRLQTIIATYHANLMRSPDSEQLARLAIDARRAADALQCAAYEVRTVHSTRTATEKEHTELAGLVAHLIKPQEGDLTC